MYLEGRLICFRSVAVKKTSEVSSASFLMMQKAEFRWEIIIHPVSKGLLTT